MSQKLVEVKKLRKYFTVKGGFLHAVDDIDFHINTGETLGLVGESGCGKSTTGYVLVRLEEANGGEIFFDGKDMLKFRKSEVKHYRKSAQIVFQDPFSSLNPRMPISGLIAEPLEVSGLFRGKKKEMMSRVKELMEIVGIKERLMNTYPHELDGGMRQRVGIARALAINPKFIVLDEPVSALDVCIQAQILNLLKRLQREMSLTYLFISHDLSVVKFISDRIAVMYLGKIVELSDRNTLFKNPLHPYTQALLSAIPVPKLNTGRVRLILRGDVPSPVNPPEGCRFAMRCNYVQAECTEKTPEMREIKGGEEGHFVSCHYAENLKESVQE